MRKEGTNAQLQYGFHADFGIKRRHTDTQNSYLHEKYITSCISPSMHDKCLLFNVPAATWPDGKLPATLQQNKRSVIHSSPDLATGFHALAVTLHLTSSNQMCEAVQDFIDLLTVCEANVRFPHKTPYLLPDVIFIDLDNSNINVS